MRLEWSMIACAAIARLAGTLLRDVTANGMVGVGAYSGDPQHARYETYDREVDPPETRMARGTCAILLREPQTWI